MSIDFTNEKEIAETQERLVGEKEIATNVSDCAACGGSHEGLTFVKLKQSVDDGSGIISTHAGECPQTGLQLKLGWPPSSLIAAREKAAQAAQVGKQLHIDGMDEADIARVLAALKEA